MNNESGFNSIENLSNIYNSTISLKKASLHPNQNHLNLLKKCCTTSIPLKKILEEPNPLLLQLPLMFLVTKIKLKIFTLIQFNPFH